MGVFYIFKLYKWYQIAQHIPYMVDLFRRHTFSELLLKAKPDVLLFSRNIEIKSYMALLRQSLLVLHYTKFNKKTKKKESFANFLTYRKLEFVKHKLGQQLQ